MPATLASRETGTESPGRRRTALELYLRDIAYNDLLTPQQEVQLAKRIRKKSIPCDGVVDQMAVDETAAELSEEEAGRKLFELAAACREAGIDPESALRSHACKVVATLTERHSMP